MVVAAPGFRTLQAPRQFGPALEASREEPAPFHRSVRFTQAAVRILTSLRTRALDKSR